MKLLCAFLLVSSALLAQVIQGTVTDSFTGAPLGGVTVGIESGGKALYTTTTDARGAFRIEGVAGGSYTARFSKQGFQPPDRDAAALRPFRVTAGSDPIRLEARMTPLGKISGRVLAGDDNPVASARIELRLTDEPMAQMKSTDQQGNFSFDPVRPGRYTLKAQPPADLKPPAPSGDRRLGWVRTYYPDAPDLATATTIIIQPASELSGYDVKLRAVPVHRLRGVVLDPRGDPSPRILVKAETTDEYPPVEFQATSAEDGSFEFPALHDSEWRLTAQKDGAESKFTAFTTTVMAGSDLDRQVLRLSPPFSQQGSVSFDVSGALQTLRSRTGVYLEPLGGGSNSPQSPIDQDGNFKMENVSPGLYKIHSISTGPPFYLASITLGDRSLLGQFVELSSGSPPIRITYKSDGGGVRGTVKDCRGALVKLMLRDADLRDSQLVRSAACDATGRFEIPGIRPGSYYAWAHDRVEMVTDFISRVDESLINQAVTVQIRSGETGTLDLRVTDRVNP
jgi:hypothetical protein